MDGVEMVAHLMAISATTAPKSKGENFVKTRVLKGSVLMVWFSFKNLFRYMILQNSVNSY